MVVLNVLDLPDTVFHFPVTQALGKLLQEVATIQITHLTGKFYTLPSKIPAFKSHYQSKRGDERE